MFLTENLPALETGDASKDFALRDNNKQIHTLGNIILNTEVTLLELISVYCHSCIMKVAEINQIADEYSEKGVSVIAIALGNNQLEVNTFIEKTGVKYPVFADPKKTVLHLYGIHKVPQFFLIDNSGIIKYRGTAKDIKKIKSEIDILLDNSGMFLHAGEPAVEFSLPDMNNKTVDVIFLKNHQNTTLAFFTGDDDQNISQACILSQIYKENINKGIKFIGVISKSFSGRIRNFADKCSIKFPLLIDKTGEVFELYTVFTTPEIVVVNKNGRVQIRIQQTTYNELLRLHKQEADYSENGSHEQNLEFLRQMLPESIAIESMPLSNETIYVLRDTNNIKSYAHFVKKNILCNVCSDVHFVYILDQKGVFQNIVPVIPFELYGTTIDASNFLKQFIGKSYHTQFAGNENVDIISGATKSSLLLIDGLNETESIFSKYIDDSSFDSAYRNKICFTKQAEIERAFFVFNRKHGIPLENININDVEPYCHSGKIPLCPSGGKYEKIIFNNIPRIMCTVHGLDPESSTYSLR